VPKCRQVRSGKFFAGDGIAVRPAASVRDVATSWGPGQKRLSLFDRRVHLFRPSLLSV
jgi:hypothetical protein